MNRSVCYIQFAKRPFAGYVKTRLIPALGAEGALLVHIELLQLTLNALSETPIGDVQLWWDRQWDSSQFLSQLDPQCHNISRLSQHEQQGDDLGEKMQHALITALTSHSKVVLVGSDCPVINADYLLQASTLLEEKDIVLGPSDDGGFVLIGARRVEAGLLEGMEWGVASVLQHTLQRIQTFALSCALLQPLFDVDEVSDYRRWKGRR